MFRSFIELQELCDEKQLPVWQVIQLDDAQDQDISAEASWEKMCHLWDVMKASVEGYTPNMRSRSGLVGGEGGKMDAYLENHEPLSGSFSGKVISRALKMGCANACMHRIVAAPTAGACGVLPAVLYSCWKDKGAAEEEIVKALYIAAGVGQIIAQRAFLAGAAGGCQAEIGSASGMAAAALTALYGGTLTQMGHACSMALKNLMGLVCDPVAGLVEVPCVKRNVGGAVNALAAADMALAGIESAIPADQVIDAMREVGEAMDPSLRETSRGGLAVTPKALEYTAKIKES